jgi:hypothetical protein
VSEPLICLHFQDAVFDSIYFPAWLIPQSLHIRPYNPR